MSLKVKKVPEFREAIYWFEELNCLTTEQRIVVNSFIQLFDYEKVISKQDIKELYDVVSVVYHHSDIDFKQSMLGVFIRSSLLNILEDSLDVELTGIAKRTRRKSSEKDEINEWVESMQNDFETISNNKDDK
ncbi:hypothetical protein IX95_07115 [Vibrio sp. B183]|uniref:hypothetical protein n=1 Tax=Vibrio sp. B183 TaxID=1526762 RepID=UPI0005025620|nr:hypothetical protein [Vibrio sp. B183]KFI12717.1 hypothetical protein IX95_07115 [Vibrio sp. B183]